MSNGRGHQLLRNLLVLLGFLHRRGDAPAGSRDQSNVWRCLKTSRKRLGLPTGLDVLLQSPKRL